jgi:CxxC motif-containing protein (DUF1111 family)
MMRQLRRRPAVVALVALAAGIVLVWILAGGDAGTASGRELFETKFTAQQGLGPLFNADACSACHAFPALGGVGDGGLATVSRIGQLTKGGFDSMVGRGGPIARVHGVAGCGDAAGIPAGATVISVRNAQSLFGVGLIDAIPDATIRAGAAAQRGGPVSGRPNLIGARVGRFGWKAGTATLEQFVAQAFRNELGLTSPQAPSDPVPDGCARASGGPDLGADVVAAVTAFVVHLPAPRPARQDPAGAAVFEATGCGACHTPILRAGDRPAPLFSDLLLHDMGPALDDRVIQETATGREWRTAPLWGLHDRPRLLHDGRAESVEAAILAHGGEAETARERFRALPDADRRRLIEFLRSL